MSLEARTSGFSMVNDLQLTNADQIKGGFQAVASRKALNDLTGSSIYDQYRTSRFVDGQIFYISSSAEFVKINKQPADYAFFLDDYGIDDTVSPEDLYIFKEEFGINEGFAITYETVSLGGGSITVRESDGGPSVSNVTTIVVSDNTLADDGSGQVTITTGGGGSDLTSLNTFTGSIQTEVDNLAAITASLNTFTGSIQTEVDSLTVVTGSYATTSSVNNLIAVTGSYLTTSSFNALTGSFVTTSSFYELTGSFLSFTSSFTDKGDDGQVRITIDAIPTESIVNFRNVGLELIGRRATGSLTVPTDFGTNHCDTLVIDLRLGYSVIFANFTASGGLEATSTQTYNGFNDGTNDYFIGGSFQASSTTDFLLAAAEVITNNSDRGLADSNANINGTPNNGIIAGLFTASVDGQTITLSGAQPGTFANNVKIAYTGSQLSDAGNPQVIELGLVGNIPPANVKALGGGTAYDAALIEQYKDQIATIPVLDISGSNDDSASFKRMDVLSFISDTYVAQIAERLDTLISQSNARVYEQSVSTFDLDSNGFVGAADLLVFLSVFGTSTNGFALADPGTSTVPGTFDRSVQDARDGLKDAGGVVTDRRNVIKNGDILIASQDSGSLIIEGDEFVTHPAKINFQDKTGGTPGNSGSGIFRSSGSLIFHSASNGSFEFNRSLIATNLSGTNTGDQNILNLAVTGSDVVFTNITASDVSASGDVIVNTLTANGNANFNGLANFNGGVTTIGDSTDDRLHINSYITSRLDVQSDISASGNITASGTIVASNLSGTNTGDQDLSSYIQASQTSSFLTSLADGTVSSSAQITAFGFISSSHTDIESLNTFTGSIQTEVDSLTDATSSYLTSIPANTLSSSAQIATEISGAFTAASSSFSTRVTVNDAKVSYTDAAVISVINAANILSSSAQITAFGFISSSHTDITDLNTFTGSIQTEVDSLTAATSSYLISVPAGTISSSAQIATEISGAFVAPSSSFSTRVTTIETNNTGTNTGDQDLSTYALIANISGAFAEPSGGFSTRVTTLETNNTGTNTGDQDLSSLAVKTAISGAFTESSSSFSTRVTTIETNNTGTNTGDQDLSGLAVKTAISGAFAEPSSSFSTRVTSIESVTDSLSIITVDITTDATTQLDSWPTASYRGAIYDYVLYDDDQNSRTGHFMVSAIGNYVSFTDTSTPETVGDASPPSIGASKVGTDVAVRISNGDGYTFKAFTKKL